MATNAFTANSWGWQKCASSITATTQQRNLNRVEEGQYNSFILTTKNPMVRDQRRREQAGQAERKSRTDVTERN